MSDEQVDKLQETIADLLSELEDLKQELSVVVEERDELREQKERADFDAREPG